MPVYYVVHVHGLAFDDSGAANHLSDELRSPYIFFNFSQG